MANLLRDPSADLPLDPHPLRTAGTAAAGPAGPGPCTNIASGARRLGSVQGPPFDHRCSTSPRRFLRPRNKAAPKGDLQQCCTELGLRRSGGGIAEASRYLVGVLPLRCHHRLVEARSLELQELREVAKDHLHAGIGRHHRRIHNQ